MDIYLSIILIPPDHYKSRHYRGGISMKEIRTNIDKKIVGLNSREVQDIIENNNYFDDVIDISHAIQDKDILAYQIKLNSSILEKEVEKDLKEGGYTVDDEDMYTAVLVEQAEYFIDAAIDEIKDRIEIRYHLADVISAYDIYENRGQGENIGFVITLAFGATNYSQLHEITNSVLDEHYTRLQ